MIGDTSLVAVAAAGERLAAAAVTSATERLAGQIAADHDDIALAVSVDSIILTAPGLGARVYGTRQRDRDPRLASLLMGGTP